MSRNATWAGARRAFTATVSAVLLGACGGGGGSDDSRASAQSSVRSSPAAQIQLTFPFGHARYSGSNLAISGRIVHPDAEDVRVWASAGGAPVYAVVSGDRFSIAALTMPAGGQVTITVSAAHPSGPTSTESFTLSREPELTHVPQMVLDATRERMLMVDSYTAAVVAQPLDGGARVIVSGSDVGAGIDFVQPVALTLGASSDVLYVADDELNAVINVDLSTGDRTLISGLNVVVPSPAPAIPEIPVTPTPLPPGQLPNPRVVVVVDTNPLPPSTTTTRTVGSGPGIFTPKEMDFDLARGMIVLADESMGVVVIDPETGDRTSFNSTNASGDYIYAHRSIGVDSIRSRYIVGDGGSFFAVDATSGHRTLLSSNQTDPVSRFILGTSIAPERNLLYVGEDMTNGIASIDLSTGLRATITASGLPAPWNFAPVGDGPIVQYPNDVVFDPVQGRLFFVEGEYADRLMRVASNGDRTIIRDASLGEGAHFRRPSGIKYDATRGTLLVADYVDDYVLEVDPRTGNRATIQAPENGRGSIDVDPMDVDYDPTTRMFYVVDWQTSSLHALNPATWSRSVVADAATGTGPQLYRPSGVLIDSSRRVAYVLSTVNANIIVVNLDTKARSVFAANVSPVAMALDRVHDRLYVAESGGAIQGVNLADFTQREIVPGSLFSYESYVGLAYDEENDRIIAVDDYPVRVYSIDVATGARAIVADQRDSSYGASSVKLTWPVGIAVDADRQIAFVTDDAYDAIVAVDLSTGARQVVSK